MVSGFLAEPQIFRVSTQDTYLGSLLDGLAFRAYDTAQAVTDTINNNRALRYGLAALDIALTIAGGPVKAVLRTLWDQAIGRLGTMAVNALAENIQANSSYSDEQAFKLAGGYFILATVVFSGVSGGIGAIRKFRQAGNAVRRLTRNGYHYDVDGFGRPRSIQGDLRLENGIRDPRAQRAAGGSDRLSTDHGGHYIARIFGGAPNGENLFAQNADFNRRAYRDPGKGSGQTTLQPVEASASRSPRSIAAIRKGPMELRVTTVVNGRSQTVRMPNAPGGR